MLKEDQIKFCPEEYEHLLGDIAINIKFFRKRGGVTLDELSLRSGVPHKMLKEIEDAEFEPSLYCLCRIAKGLDTSLMALVAR